MAYTDVIKNLESVLLDIFSTAGNYIDLNKTQYKIVKISDTEYDVGLALAGLGTQHLRISVNGPDFTIKGKFNVIADNAQWPFTMIQAMVNNTVKEWAKGGLDAVAVTGAPLALLSMPEVLPVLSSPVVLCESGACELQAKDIFDAPPTD